MRTLINKNRRRVILSAAPARASPRAGAVTAALYLQEFVEPGIPWAHLDVMAWNPQSRPGRPEGAEATALRALYAHIASRFG